MGPKEPICPEQKNFRINHCCYFHLPMALFIVQNFKKILQWIQNYDYAPFLSPKDSFAPNKNFSRKPDNEPCLFSLFLFFLKIITIILIYLLTLFFAQNLKKILPADPELWKMCNLWAHSGPFISPNKNLFRKPVNEPYFIYSCLSTCQISKSDINLLVEY